jgi:hypothetical protein
MQSHGGNCLEIHTLRLGYLEPSRGAYDSSYIQKLDGYVNLCELARIYCIINIEDLSYTTWNSGMPNWMLDSHGYGTAPYPEVTINQACIDFWDLDNSLHNDNRQSFIDLWTYLANRYKSNQYILFSIMNEPISHLTLSSRTQSQHLGITYARYMEQIIDAIRTVSDNVIVIDKPYLWYIADVQPVNRNNIIWEDHYYMNADTTTEYNTWKGYVDEGRTKFMSSFGKPLYVGEYGPNPTNMVGWQSIFTQEISYLKGKVCGSAWHTWGVLSGETYSQFTAQDSEILLTTIYS